MAKFVKGQIANPLGAGAHDKVKAALKRITNEEFKDVIDATLKGNVDQLKEIAEDPESSALKVGVARAIFNAVKKGDWPVLESIISRIVGKVPDKIEHSGIDGSPIDTSAESSEERLKRIQANMKKLQILDGQ